MIKHIIEVIGDALIIAFGGLSLFMFIDIWQHGVARYCEPNSIILNAEIFLAVVAIGIGIERGYDDLFGKKMQVKVAEGGSKMNTHWRPQILAAITVLGTIAVLGLFNGMVEVATGCTGGIIALGMELLKGE